MNKILICLLYIQLIFSSDRPTSEPYISGDGFRRYANFIFDENTTTFAYHDVSVGDVVFVETGPIQNLIKFFNEIHPKINSQYVLVTHNGDTNIPGEFKKYLDDEKIFVWFAQNIDMKHKKLIPIPIGLENRRWKRNFVEIINEIKQLKINTHKNFLLYGNFNIGTNPIERQSVYNYFKNQAFAYFPKPKSTYEYLIDVAHSKFIVSPHGNGLDCHRTWEALCLDTFVIVKESTIDVLYEDLPVVIVNDWNEVNEIFLNKKYEELKNKKYKTEKLNLNYWLNLIQEKQKECQIKYSTYLPTKNFKSVFPYITGETVKEYCDHILDATDFFDPNDVNTGDTIFVMINFLEHFFDIYHPKIKNPYILVTHHFFDESDDPVPGKFAKYLNEAKLIAWFSHNIDISENPKMHFLPLGISGYYYRPHNNKLFDYGILKYKDKLERNKLLFMGFTINTYLKERELVFNIFKDKSYCTNIKNIQATRDRSTGINQLNGFDDFLKDLATHKFILSPRGNGLDCFRTWEALLMGCYPIVISSTLDPLFEDLPVLIIKDWNEINEEFLERKYKEMSNKKYNLDKLYMPYWLNQIKLTRPA